MRTDGERAASGCVQIVIIVIIGWVVGSHTQAWIGWAFGLTVLMLATDSAKD